MRRFRVTSVSAPRILVILSVGGSGVDEDVELVGVVGSEEVEETSVARKRENVLWLARQVLRRSSEGPAVQRVESWG
jgi:hypothetical protein